MSKSINKPMDGMNNNREEREAGALDEITNKVRSAGKAARDFAEEAGGNISKVRSNAEAQIREHPISASIVILASGFLLGSLLRRR
jgi:hypothetical protein